MDIVDCEQARILPKGDGGSKKLYAKPSLQTYGSVKEMTRSGSGSNSECGNSGGSKFCVTSDRRVKENIIKIGRHPLGIGLYLFNYKPEFCAFGVGRQFGVMADEVEVVLPGAVCVNASGYKMVDHKMLGISR